MQLTRYDDIHAFRRDTHAFLLRNEVENNLLLGIAGDIAETTIYDEYQPYLATVSDDGQIVAVALRTPPHNLQISRAPEEAVALIADDVLLLYPDLPGAQGPRETSRTFVELWQKRTGRAFSLSIPQRIYALETVNPIPHVAGLLRPATAGDFNLAVTWWLAFEAEALNPSHDSRAQAERAVQHRLEAHGSGLYLWDDGQPVSLAGYGGPTPNGIRVGPVYTPPEFRQRGYGTAATAALSQLLLDSGRRICFLFTDLNNPTSNSIYQRIGYHPASDIDYYRIAEA